MSDFQLRHIERAHFADDHLPGSAVQAPVEAVILDVAVPIWSADTVIKRRRPWKSIEAVEFEQSHYRQQEAQALAA